MSSSARHAQQTRARELLHAAAQLAGLGDEDWFVVRVAAYVQDAAEQLLQVQSVTA